MQFTFMDHLSFLLVGLCFYVAHDALIGLRNYCNDKVHKDHIECNNTNNPDNPSEISEHHSLLRLEMLKVIIA